MAAVSCRRDLNSILGIGTYLQEHACESPEVGCVCMCVYATFFLRTDLSRDGSRAPDTVVKVGCPGDWCCENQSHTGAESGQVSTHYDSLGDGGDVTTAGV